jgi:hypothetical protein
LRPVRHCNVACSLTHRVAVIQTFVDCHAY